MSLDSPVVSGDHQEMVGALKLLEDQIRRENARNSEIRGRIHDLNRQHQENLALITDESKKIALGKQRCKIHEVNIEHISESLEEKGKDIAKKYEKRLEAGKELRKAEDALELAEIENQMSREKLASLDVKLEEAEERMAALLTKKALLENANSEICELKALKEEPGSREQIYELREQELKARIQEMNALIAEVEEEVYSMEVENAKLCGISASTSTSDTSPSQFLISSIKKLEKKIEKKTRELNKLKNRSTITPSSNISSLRTELDKITATNEETKNKIRNLQDEMRCFTEIQIKDTIHASTALPELQNEITQLRSTAAKLEADLRTFKSDSSTLSKEIKAMASKVATKKAVIRYINTQIDDSHKYNETIRQKMLKIVEDS